VSPDQKHIVHASIAAITTPITHTHINIHTAHSSGRRANHQHLIVHDPIDGS
jgi:hypothetical protein